jgi:parvulin-like peptidyl-prolyl isomerase
MAACTRITLAVGVILTLTPILSPAQSDSMVDGVAAIVNDKVITFNEVRKQVDSVENTLRQTYDGQELRNRIKEARLNALKSLIEKELIIQDFNKKGFFLPETYIDDRLKEVIQTSFDGDRTAFTRTIQANGISLEQYKSDLRDNIIVQQMRFQNVSRAVIISPYKIERYYQDNLKEFTQEEQIKLSIIFLRKALFKEKRKNDKGEEEEYDPAEEEAKEILFKLNAGTDFSELAKAYSEGKNRETGGDWGWVTKKDLRPEIIDAASHLQPGQNTGVVTTDDGYYIVRLEDSRRARIQPMNEIRADIERNLIQQDRQQIQQEWLDGLRAKAYIKMF